MDSPPEWKIVNSALPGGATEGKDGTGTQPGTDEQFSSSCNCLVPSAVKSQGG